MLCPGASCEAEAAKLQRHESWRGRRNQVGPSKTEARDLTAKPQVARFFRNLQDITITPPASNGT